MPFAQTGNIKTYYELHGQGPPIVFIHGDAGSHDNWSPQTEYFSENFNVLTYDLRGHQQSGGSDDKYTCALLAEDLHSLLEAVEISEPVICGQSFGGMIAQKYAVKYQTDIHGLVLADTVASTSLTVREKIERTFFPPDLVKKTVRRMSPESYADLDLKYFAIAPEIRDYLKKEQLKMDRQEMVKLIDAKFSFRLLPLREIRVPTLIVTGENETKRVFRHAEVMLKMIPGSRKVIVPGAGHVPNLENPDYFNRELEDFLHALVISSF